MAAAFSAALPRQKAGDGDRDREERVALTRRGPVWVPGRCPSPPSRCLVWVWHYHSAPFLLLQHFSPLRVTPRRCSPRVPTAGTRGSSTPVPPRSSAAARSQPGPALADLPLASPAPGAHRGLCQRCSAASAPGAAPGQPRLHPGQSRGSHAARGAAPKGQGHRRATREPARTASSPSRSSLRNKK